MKKLNLKAVYFNSGIDTSILEKEEFIHPNTTPESRTETSDTALDSHINYASRALVDEYVISRDSKHCPNAIKNEIRILLRGAFIGDAEYKRMLFNNTIYATSILAIDSMCEDTIKNRIDNKNKICHSIRHILSLADGNINHEAVLALYAFIIYFVDRFAE